MSGTPNPPDLQAKLSFRISEVAEMTGLPERWLLAACRAGEFDHIRTPGNRYVGMTRAQIDAMLEQLTESNGARRAKADAVERAKSRARNRMGRERATQVAA